jgi:Mu-like prophage tail protein gpP
MPTPVRPALRIGDFEHADWIDYSIDSDLMTPADAWQFTLAPSESDTLPTLLAQGQPVKITLGNSTIMSGRMDCVEHAVDRRGRRVTMHGRDGAAALVDCSSPIFVARQIGLADIVAKVVRPLGITRVRIDADSATVREKVNVEPGEQAWDTIRHAAEANGLWPWFEPDGTLVIGRPNKPSAPVATLRMQTGASAIQNNLVSLSETRDVARRHSEITVLGQAHGTASESGRNALKATARDSGVGWYRPRIVVDYECDNTGIALARGRKLLADARLEGYTLAAHVLGHWVDATATNPVPGHRASACIWSAGRTSSTMCFL